MRAVPCWNWDGATVSGRGKKRTIAVVSLNHVCIAIASLAALASPSAWWAICSSGSHDPLCPS